MFFQDRWSLVTGFSYSKMQDMPRRDKSSVNIYEDLLRQITSTKRALLHHEDIMVMDHVDHLS